MKSDNGDCSFYLGACPVKRVVKKTSKLFSCDIYGFKILISFLFIEIIRIKDGMKRPFGRCFSLFHPYRIHDGLRTYELNVYNSSTAV